MTESVRFTNVCKRTDAVDVHLCSLAGSLGKPALFALYLARGTSVPDEAKHTAGVLFGFCDAKGVQVPRTSASHVGWTLDEEVGL